MNNKERMEMWGGVAARAMRTPEKEFSQGGHENLEDSKTKFSSEMKVTEKGVLDNVELSGFSPEALERTLDRLDKLVEIRKERRQKMGLSDQDVRKESESYNAIRSEIIKLRNRLKKIQEGEEVDLEEVRNLKSELLGHLAKYRAEMKSASTLGSETEEAEVVPGEVLPEEPSASAGKQNKKEIDWDAGLTGEIVDSVPENLVTINVQSNNEEQEVYTNFEKGPKDIDDVNIGDETMSLLSPEYKDWQSAKASFREARRLLHEEMSEVQEKNRGLLSIFKKTDTSRMEELGKEYERLEQCYINSLDRYKAYKREQLPADEDINARTNSYEKSKLKTLGVWEGVKLSSLESPKGLRVTEQFADLHEKFRNLPKWQRWTIGSALIAGTPFAASLISGVGFGVAGVAVGKNILRYGATTGMGALAGGFTFSKYFADRKFRKEQTKVDVAKIKLSSAKGEAVGGSKEAVVSEVRELIRTRNNAYLQALRDQKVRAARSGLMASAVTGGVISGGLSFGLENLHDVTNGVGEVAGTSTGADTAPAGSTPSVGTTQPEQIAYSDQTEPIKVPEPDEHVLGRGVKPELNQPTVPSYGGVSDSIATPDSTEAGTASVHTESAAEVLPSETTVFSPKPYTIERGDTVWDWAEGQTNAPQPPAFAEVAPDKLRQLIHYTVEKIKDNPELAKSMGVNPYNNPSTWLFEGGTLTPEQQSMFSQIARSVAIERGY